MAETSRLKRKCTANRKVWLDLLKQAKDITMEERLTDHWRDSLETIMRNVNEKDKLVKIIDEELVNIINEEDIADYIEKLQSLQFRYLQKQMRLSRS